MSNFELTALALSILAGFAAHFFLTALFRAIFRTMSFGCATRQDGGKRPRFSKVWPTISLEPVHEPHSLPDVSGSGNEKLEEAMAMLSHLRSERDPTFARVVGSLRRMNAYALEELIGYCLYERGMEGHCPSGYSRDGGIDCIAFRGGRPIVVQVKRWKKHVNNRDLVKIAEVASSVHGMGLFVHTGRTGRMAWRKAFQHHVSVISGGLLVDLVLGNGVEVPWREPTYADSTPEPLPPWLPLFEPVKA